MNIKLRLDGDMSVQKLKIGRVPTLILKPKAIEPARVGLLWIHGGGYIMGLKETVYMSRAADILKRYGLTVFSPGYLLAWLHPYAAPSRQTDYRDLPPCYTFVGEGEPFYAETLQYVANLKAAGVEAEADVYPTNVHGFDLLYPDEEIAKQAEKKLLERVGFALQQEV